MSRPTRRSAVDYVLTGLSAAAIAIALLAVAVSVGLAPPPSAHNSSRTWPKAPAPLTSRTWPKAAVTVQSAAYALPARPGMSASSNIQLGMQYVSVSFRVNSKYAGRPHARIYNNGPDPVRVATLKVNGMSDRGKYLRPGQSQTLSRGWVRVAGATAVARFAVVDQVNGIPGSKTLRLGGGFEPVRATSLVAAVQLAAGRLAADGDYGPLTSARLQYIRAHWRALPATVARVQAAYGVSADGVWGGQTEAAYERLRNAALYRY